MEKKLNEKFEESSLERIRKVSEELKKVGGESKKENPQAVTDLPSIQKEEKIAPEIKFAEIKTELSDLTQERLKLEKILQEINNLKGRICQRIEFIKTLERRKREIEKQLTSLGEENPNFLEETKKKLDNLREHIK
ncbi:MAG: hypothetical protein Q8M00_01345 [bacterium]|nr:hypothetical protein [bacterium]